MDKLKVGSSLSWSLQSLLCVDRLVCQSFPCQCHLSDAQAQATFTFNNLQGNVFVNQYLVIKDLGRGAHGTVKLVFDTEQQAVYAMKVRH